MPVRWRQLFSLNFRNRWKIMTSSHDNVFFQEKPKNLQWMFIFCMEENHWKKIFFFQVKHLAAIIDHIHWINCVCVCVLKTTLQKQVNYIIMKREWKAMFFNDQHLKIKTKKKCDACVFVCVCVTKLNFVVIIISWSIHTRWWWRMIRV